MKDCIGTLVHRNRFYAWRHLNPITNRYTQETLKDEDGVKITDRKQALRRMHELAAERFRAESLNSRIEYIQQIAEVKQIVHTCKVRFKDLKDAFEHHPARHEGQLENKFSSINHIVHWMAENYPDARLLADMTDEIAGEYLVQYWKSGISPKTYNTRLQCLKMIFHLFLKDDNPFKEYPYKQGEGESRAAFTIEQLTAIGTLLASDYPMMHKDEMIVLYFLAIYTGARCGDLCQLKWQSVDLQRNLISFTPSKTKGSSGKKIEMPIAPALRDALIKAETWHSNEYILPKVCERYRYNPSGISHDTTAMLEAAGIKTKEEAETSHRKLRISRYGFHSFRHCYATMLINQGVNPLVVCDLMGHTSTAMTARYSHIALDTKKEAINALPQLSIAAKSPASRQKKFAEILPKLDLRKIVDVGNFLDDHLPNCSKIELLKILEHAGC